MFCACWGRTNVLHWFFNSFVSFNFKLHRKNIKAKINHALKHMHNYYLAYTCIYSTRAKQLLFIVMLLLDYNYVAPVAETGFSHRLTAYKIVGHFFGLSYREISLYNQVENSFLESVTFQLHARMLSSEVAQSSKSYGHFSDLGVGIAREKPFGLHNLYKTISKLWRLISGQLSSDLVARKA